MLVIVMPLIFQHMGAVSPDDVLVICVVGNCDTIIEFQLGSLSRCNEATYNIVHLKL